jgi:hypothetical protein
VKITIMTFSPKLLAIALLASAAVVHGVPCANSVDGFKFYNVITRVSYPLTSGSSVYHYRDGGSCQANFEAVTTSCPSDPIKCVNITLGTQSRTEREAPWYLYGDKAGNYPYYHAIVNAGTPETGPQTLKACAFTDTDCTVAISDPACKSIAIDIKGGELYGFLLFNAEHSVWESLLGNKNICFNPAGVGLAVEVYYAYPCVKQVYLKLTGNGKTVTRTENEAPSTLFGDTPGGEVTFKNTFVTEQEYTIEATPNGDSTRTTKAIFTFHAPGTGGCPPVP